MSDETMLIEQINDKLYMSARAYIVENKEQLPRAMAAEWEQKQMNDSFLWIAGRYAQANQPNKNNDYWSYDDIVAGESSIKHTPLNVLHKWDRPVGTFVETKIVHRQPASDESEVLPEIQALAVLWAANFPSIAQAAKDAHDVGRLWYSLECTAETVQCMSCEKTFAVRAAASEQCEHLVEKTSARRWINPTFLGGALIFPPANPGWKDADITSVASELIREYANRKTEQPPLTTVQWEDAMASLQA